MIIINNKVIKINNKWINIDISDPYNPLNLPPYTIRLKYSQGVTPTFSKGTGTLVDSENNVWDLTYENSDWSQILYSHTDLLEVLGANTTGVTNMYRMFRGSTSLTTVSIFDTSSVTNMEEMFRSCSTLTNVQLLNTSNVTNMKYMFNSCSALTTVPLFNTSSATNMMYMFGSCSNLTTTPLFNTANVTSMYCMFYSCSSLTSIPLFDTSSVTDMAGMFSGCSNVQSGAYALYQQASTQTTPPTYHTDTFKNCGSNTETGAIELTLIPTSWGGIGE